MPLVSQSVPSFKGGVSQQPDIIRFPDQVTELINGFPNEVEGLQKRPPTIHVKRISDKVDANKKKYHIINRDETEQYILQLGSGEFQVFDLKGNARSCSFETDEDSSGVVDELDQIIYESIHFNNNPQRSICEYEGLDGNSIIIRAVCKPDLHDYYGGMYSQDIELIDEDYLEITILPKGFGSENNNAMKMALPAEGIQGIKDFVVESVLKAKGKPCPPTVIGVGIGGTSDLCLKLGKKALLGEVGKRNPDPEIAKLELEILEEINKSGIGPMGLGGKTTTLDVKILKAHTHTAGLPVGVCVQCWADRHATTKIYDKK